MKKRVFPILILLVSFSAFANPISCFKEARNDGTVGEALHDGGILKLCGNGRFLGM